MLSSSPAPQNPPPKPLWTHQQVDAAGDAQADGAQDGGEEETGGDSQAVTEIRHSEGVGDPQPTTPDPAAPLTPREGRLGCNNSWSGARTASPRPSGTSGHCRATAEGHTGCPHPEGTPSLPISRHGIQLCSHTAVFGGDQDPQFQEGHGTHHLSMVEPFFLLLLGYSSRQTRTPAALPGRQGKEGIAPKEQTRTPKMGCVGRGKHSWEQGGEIRM